MSNASVSCWHCTRVNRHVILPLSRREECEYCKKDFHVCVMCKHCDGRGGCNEPRAEHVSDQQKANFCDYLELSYAPFESNGDDKSTDAKAQLAALFGDAPKTFEATEPQDETSLSPAQLAEQKLRKLLGDDQSH